MPAPESLVHAFPFPVAVLDEKGRITIANSEWERFSRKPLAPALFGRQGTEYLAACRQAAAEGWNVANRLIRGFREVSTGAKPSFSLEYQGTEADAERWFRLTASPLPEGGMLVVQHNETAARQAKAQLLLLTTAINASTIALVVTDPEGIIQEINPAFTRLTGYTEAEAVGRHTRLLKSGKQSDATYQELWRTILAGKRWEGTLINQRKDGSLYHERMWITPVKNDAGFVTRFIALKEDITERVRHERVLREERAFSESIVERIPIQIFVKDAADLRYVRVNAALEDALGYTRDELLDKTDYDFWPKDQADFFVQKDREVLQSGKPLDIPEEPIRTESGETRWLHTQKVPILGPDGEPVYLLGISEDITDRKQWERELVEGKEQAEAADRLKTTLLHQLNHEIRTPLTSIIGFAEHLVARGEVEEAEPAHFIYQSGVDLLKLFETATESVHLAGRDSTADALDEISTVAASPPRRQAEQEAVTLPSAAFPPGVDVAKRRLFVVEDDYITRRLMERALSATFEVATAESYQKALETLTAEPFDACLFDIDLDGNHTGIELLYAMRDVPGYARVPVIACTAHVMGKARERFLALGFQGYIAKPFTKKRLEETIDEAFEAEVTSEENSSVFEVKLPAPPTTLIETVRLLNASTDESDLEGLTRLVDRDPVAAAWVLRHVNSAYFNLSRRIVRIDHAVKLLGFKPVCNLILGGVLSHAFVDQNDPALKKIHEHIQHLSVTTAAVARHVAGAVDVLKGEQETLFTGSLLHQLGRILLLNKYGAAYGELWRNRTSTARWSEFAAPTRGREFLAFETDYVRLGAQAARAWRLGEPITTMLWAQEHPQTVGETQLQQQVLLMGLSRVAATTLVERASSFPECFKETQARRWLQNLAEQLDLPREALLGLLEQALEATKRLGR